MCVCECDQINFLLYIFLLFQMIDRMPDMNQAVIVQYNLI